MTSRKTTKKSAAVLAAEETLKNYDQAGPLFDKINGEYEPMPLALSVIASGIVSSTLSPFEVANRSIAIYLALGDEYRKACSQHAEQYNKLVDELEALGTKTASSSTARGSQKPSAPASSGSRQSPSGTVRTSRRRGKSSNRR